MLSPCTRTYCLFTIRITTSVCSSAWKWRVVLIQKFRRELYKAVQNSWIAGNYYKCWKCQASCQTQTLYRVYTMCSTFHRISVGTMLHSWMLLSFSYSVVCGHLWFQNSGLLWVSTGNARDKYPHKSILSSLVEYKVNQFLTVAFSATNCSKVSLLF